MVLTNANYRPRPDPYDGQLTAPATQFSPVAKSLTIAHPVCYHETVI
jgi:hypothetical protein